LFGVWCFVFGVCARMSLLGVWGFGGGGIKHTIQGLETAPPVPSGVWGHTLNAHPYASVHCRVPGFGFRVPDSGFRLPASGFRSQGSRFRVPGSRFRILGSGLRVLGFWFRAPGFGFRVPASRFRIQGSSFQVSGSRFRAPDSGFRVLGFVFRVSGSRLPEFGLPLPRGGALPPQLGPRRFARNVVAKCRRDCREHRRVCSELI
jgi:hypothetical protein